MKRSKQSAKMIRYWNTVRAIQKEQPKLTRREAQETYRELKSTIGKAPSRNDVYSQPARTKEVIERATVKQQTYFARFKCETRHHPFTGEMKFTVNRRVNGDDPRDIVSEMLSHKKPKGVKFVAFEYGQKQKAKRIEDWDDFIDYYEFDWLDNDDYLSTGS